MSTLESMQVKGSAAIIIALRNIKEEALVNNNDDEPM